MSTAVFFRPEYGLDLLVEAVARLRCEYPLLGCVVMGSGNRDEAAALVRRRGLHGAIHFAGDLEHDECVKVIARSNVFVRPSRADGDSISVREAVALGVPTVASNVGTRPEGAHLFPVGDVDALVAGLRTALRQRRCPWRSGPGDTVRRLLKLYGEGEGRNRLTPAWIAELGRTLARPRGMYVYVRARARD
jgi:glycosyltransferase involved in cell wall biosynthesis